MNEARIDSVKIEDFFNRYIVYWRAGAVREEPEATSARERNGRPYL